VQASWTASPPATLPKSRLQAFLAQSFVATSLLGVAVAFSYGAASDSSALALVVPNALATLLALCLVSATPRRATRVGLIGLVLFYGIAGLPGVLLNFDLDPAPGLLTSILLIARTVSIVLILPSNPNVQPEDIARWTIKWLYLSALFLSLSAVRYYLATHTTVALDERLNPRNDWLHANRLGQYAAVLILCSLLLNQKLYVRLPSLFLGLVILMMSQSRGSMLALAVGLIVYVVIRWHDIRMKLLPLVAVPVVLLLGTTFGSDMQDQILGFGPIAAIIHRTQEHGDSGRSELIGEFIGPFLERPIFGYGYKGGSYSYSDRVVFVENALVSVAMESGLVGASLYLIVTGTCLFAFARAAWRLRFAPGGPSVVGPLFHAQAGFVLVAFLLADGLTEKIHMMQAGDTLPNAVTLLVGCLCFTTLGLRRRSGAESWDVNPGSYQRAELA